MIFKPSKLQKVPEYNIFQETLFCTLASSMNFERNVVPVAGGQYLRRDFIFNVQKTDHFWCFNTLLNK